MVEYGGGVNNGPAGQAGGGNGAPELGQQVDVLSSVGNFVHDATNMVAAWPPEVLVAAIAIFFVGLIVLRRAF